MKQRVLERARSTVDAVLRKHCPDTTLEVLPMYPEEGSYGDVRRDFALHVLTRVRADG